MCICHREVDSFPIGCNIKECYFLILYNEMYQHLEDLRNSVNKCFPNDQCVTFQNHSQARYPFKVQGWQVDFSVTEYREFTDMASESSLQLTFKKPPLVDLWCTVKEEYLQSPLKTIKILLSPFQLPIWVKQSFLFFNF